VQGNFPLDQGHPNAGPKRISWFGDIALPDTEQWFYHAVADVIRANSLLRSFPEINPKKIGLTGISWGGTIVSTVAGVDPRFAFIIPVYGGGLIVRLLDLSVRAEYEHFNMDQGGNLVSASVTWTFF